ncbi:MAG: 4-(cytidine 5'-diphospho)-2-C-methyl-D-erythritol kinase [Bacteroidales bacterium]
MFSYPSFKINIGLNILQKREDGYHELETVFYPVHSQKDILEIKHIGKGVKLKVFNLDFLCEVEDNLCVKAFRLLQKDFPIDGIEIILTKNIPVGAGLGGGSADAAFALKMYNNLFDLKLSVEKLQEYASQLGSDTVFFIENSPAFATGRGEIVTPIALDLSAYEIRIVKPDFSISTADAYAEVKPKFAYTPLRQAIQEPVHKWKDFIQNDFEDSLFKKYPILEEMKENLYHEGAVYASLSGSGSAIYGIFRTVEF